MNSDCMWLIHFTDISPTLVLKGPVQSIYMSVFIFVHAVLIYNLSTGIGWRAQVYPKTHPVSEYEFDVIIGGDGRRNTLEGNLLMFMLICRACLQPSYCQVSPTG